MMQELPVEFKDINLVNSTKDHAEYLVDSSPVAADTIKRFNSSLTQPEYKTILREAVKRGTVESSVNCKEEVRTGDGWLSLDWFPSQKSYEDCLRFCESKAESTQNCSCATLSKGNNH